MVPSFDEIKIGDVAEVLHTISEKDVEQFVQLTGDDNRLHVDSEYARRTPLKERVVHGMLGASFISTVIGTKMPGDGALWYSQSLEFVQPVRLGDRIRVAILVLEKIARDSTIVLETNIFNQHGQLVTKGIARVQVVSALPLQPDQTPDQRTRTSLIVGAGGGIGEAVAMRLAERGDDVVLVYRSSPDRIHRTENKCRAMGRRVMSVQGDVRDEGFVTELGQRVLRFSDGLDYAVNTATGAIVAAPILDANWSEFQSHIDASVKTSFLMIKLLAPIMRGRRLPAFVFLTSMAVDAPVEGWSAYSAAKAALEGLVRTAAVDLAAVGIRANLVSPGMVDTSLIADLPKRARLLIEAKAPLRRLASPADVASAVEYLASDAASYVTGETVRVNGGQVMV